LRLITLRDTKIAFLTPKTYDEHPIYYIAESILELYKHYWVLAGRNLLCYSNLFSKLRLVFMDTTRKLLTSMFMRMIGIARQKNTNTALAAKG